MKINLQTAVWATALAVAVTILGAPTLAIAQSQQGLEHGQEHNSNNHNDYANNQYYHRGLSAGQDDASHKRVRQYRNEPDNDYDRTAYQAGYDQGYQNNNSYRRDDNERYGNGPNSDQQSQNPGYQMGFRDGSTDGRNDRAAGRPFKYGPGCKHPDRGYQNNYGDKILTNSCISRATSRLTNRATAAAGTEIVRENGNHGNNCEHYGYGQNQNPVYQARYRDGNTDGSNDRTAARGINYGLGYSYSGIVDIKTATATRRTCEQQYRDAYQKGYEN